LAELYPERVMIPEQVHSELSFPGVRQLTARIDDLLSQGKAKLVHIETGTEAFDLYYALSTSPSHGHTIIGRGEAACIALAKTTGGIVASNNLRDVSSYIKELGLRLMTTGDILVEAYTQQLITEDQGNDMWAKMIQKHRKLGAKTFSGYLLSR
jgi:predicted nucleic acid-binding protein